MLRVMCPPNIILDVKIEARIGQTYEEWNVFFLERRQSPDKIAVLEIRTH